MEKKFYLIYTWEYYNAGNSIYPLDLTDEQFKEMAEKHGESFTIETLTELLNYNRGKFKGDCYILYL